MGRTVLSRIIHLCPWPQGEPSESKAMGLCLEADYKSQTVERFQQLLPFTDMHQSSRRGVQSVRLSGLIPRFTWCVFFSDQA